MANVYYYVDINTSADAVTGTGIDISAFNYSQFLTQLSRNDETTDLNYFYLKGYRNITDSGVNGTTNRWLISKGTTEINSWGTEPWKINCSADFYFESILDWVTTVKIQNGFIQCDPLSLKFSVSVNYVNFTFENCWLRCGINDGLDSRFSGGRLNFINCTLQNFILENYNYNDLSFINTIIYNDTANSYYLIQNIPYTYLAFNNVISNRWIYEPTSADNYNVLDPTGSHFIVSSSINSDSIWDAVWSAVPYSFNKEISAIVKEDISYLSSGFSAIDISGNTNYTSTWYDGIRDGIGALYFPPISGFAVSASSASAPVDVLVDFVISGNDPFTVFGASSAIYNWDDGTGVSSVNNNAVISHDFSNNGSYQVNATIQSSNKWYSVTAMSWTVYVGGFNVTIVIYDHLGNNITGGQTKPLNRLTFSATVNGLDVGSYFWNLDDGYSASANPSYQSYRIAGLKNIELSAYSLDDPTISAIDTSTINISATSSEYYVNIVTAYDVCANNVGTSADPFNWSEFKGRVETSGEYLDTYRLSGSRVLSDAVLLNIDKTKNFTIRDWDVWNYGPWVWQAKDFTVSDNNSVINAAGCTLKNGIIYNKRYSSPGYGGQITIGTTYDMFIVYQGKYSHIIIDPYQNILSGTGIFSGTSAFTVWNTVSSTSSMSANYCESPSNMYTTETPIWLSAWANSRSLSSCYWIEDDFETSSFNCWWSSAFSASYDLSSVSGSEVTVMKLKDDANPFRSLVNSGTSISGDFIYETSMFRRTGASNIQGIAVFATSADFSNMGDWLRTNGCIVKFGGSKNLTYLFGNTFDSGVTALTHPQLSADIIGLRLQRNNGIISAFYKDGENDWAYIVGGNTTVNYSQNVYASVGGNGYEGFDYFRLAAQSGLPNSYTFTVSSVSSTSSVDYVSGTPITVITSAYANIIGSTIYLSAENISAWQDTFTLSDYSAVGQNNYNVRLTDSVFTNFIRENNRYLSASNLIINNCTFNNTLSAISANTSGVIISSCQFSWNPPLDYPFTPNNNLYNKDIDYILINKKKLRPFDGFTIPPNPGLNYSAYSGYETGLFGFDRKNYITSAT